MRKFKVEVRETLSRTVFVNAYNDMDAIERLEEMYRDAKIVLNDGDYDGVKFYPMEITEGEENYDYN